MHSVSMHSDMLLKLMNFDLWLTHLYFLFLFRNQSSDIGSHLFICFHNVPFTALGDVGDPLSWSLTKILDENTGLTNLICVK